MPGRDLPAQAVLEMLAEHPRRLASLTARLTPAQLRATPSPGEWSATEVLAHIRSCADVWGACISRMLAEDAPTIRAVSPRSYIDDTDYVDLQFRPSLRAFTAQRTDLLAVLGSLPPKGWGRTATITKAGKPLVRTVLFYAQWLADHERIHVNQIADVAKAV
jgi:DinB superfamily